MQWKGWGNVSLTTAQAWIEATGMPNGMLVLIVVVAVWTLAMVALICRWKVRGLQDRLQDMRACYRTLNDLYEQQVHAAGSTDLIGTAERLREYADALADDSGYAGMVAGHLRDMANDLTGEDAVIELVG